MSGPPASSLEARHEHVRGAHAWLTWAAVPLLHPDVAVVLGHPRLRVQEGEAHAALCAEPRVVAAAVLNGFLVELVPEPARERERGGMRPGEMETQPEGN